MHYFNPQEESLLPISQFSATHALFIFLCNSFNLTVLYQFSQRYVCSAFPSLGRLQLPDLYKDLLIIHNLCFQQNSRLPHYAYILQLHYPNLTRQYTVRYFYPPIFHLCCTIVYIQTIQLYHIRSFLFPYRCTWLYILAFFSVLSVS